MEALLRERAVLLATRPKNKQEEEIRKLYLTRIRSLLYYYRKKNDIKDVRNERSKQYYQAMKSKMKLDLGRRNMTSLTRIPQQYIKRSEDVEEEEPRVVSVNFCPSFD
jgi:hypothetical protein